MVLSVVIVSPRGVLETVELGAGTVLLIGLVLEVAAWVFGSGGVVGVAGGATVDDAFAAGRPSVVSAPTRSGEERPLSTLMLIFSERAALPAPSYARA